MVVWFFLATYLFFYNGVHCDIPVVTEHTYSYESMKNQSKACEILYPNNVQSGVININPPEKQQKSRALTNKDRLKFRLLKAEEVNYNQAKYTVVYGDVCSGTILHKYWAITSAHCGFTGINVFAGTDYYALGKSFRVCAHYAHFEYMSKQKKNWFDFDIQLLLMDDPFDDAITPVRIYNGNIYDSGTNYTTITGWGTNDLLKLPMQPDTKLRKLDMYVLDKRVCPGIHPDTGLRPIICAGYPIIENGAPCFGDSGGPATMGGDLIGIIGWTPCKGEEFTQLINVMADDIRYWMRNVTMLAWL